MVKLDIRNSRMKDFHDIWALSGSFVFEGLALSQAVARCFERRGTPWTRDVPLPLTPAFYQMTELEARWSAYLAAGAVLVPPPAQFAKIGERIIRFLAPLRESVLDGQPFGRHWPEGGPWQADEAGRVGIVQGGPYVP